MNSLHLRELSSTVVARVLTMMVRTHTGLDDLAYWTNSDSNKEKTISENSSSCNTWNVEVFVQLLKEFVSEIRWRAHEEGAASDLVCC